MKHAVFLLLFTAASALADVAPVISWPVNVNTPTPCNLALRLGETVTLRPDFGQDISAATNVVLLYQVTNSTLHSVTGSVYNATGGVAEIRFDVAPTNGTYSYDVYVSGSNAVLLRAFGTMVIYEAIDGTAVTVSQAGDGSALAPIIRWTIDPTRMVPQNITLKQGETVFLQPKFSGIDLTGATDVAIRYRPTNATGWHYEAPGSVYDATGGVVRVRWDSSIEGTNNYYRYEILAQDTNAVLLRSYGFLTILPSLTGSATTMPVRLAAAYWAELTNETATLNVSNLFIQGKAISTNGSPDDVSWKASTNDWNTVTGKVNAAALGSAAYSNAADFQPAGIYLTPSATNVFASTDYVVSATSGLVGTGDSRLSDARTPLAHLQPLSSITNAGTAAGHDAGDFATAAQGAKADTALQPATTNDWTVTGHGGLVATNDAQYLSAITNIPTAATNLTAGTLVYSQGTLYGGTNDNDGAYMLTNGTPANVSWTSVVLDPTGWTSNNISGMGAYYLTTNAGSYTLTFSNAAPMGLLMNGALTNIYAITATIPTNRAVWFVSFPNGSLTPLVTNVAWAFTDAQVATVYPDTNGIVLINRETHGLMPAADHEYNHRKYGTAYISGFDQGFQVGAASTTLVASGVVADEDIFFSLPASTTTLKAWSDGSGWMTYTMGTPTLAAITNSATGKLRYNQSGTILTDLTSAQYMAVYIYATGLQGYPLVAVLGQTAGNLTTVQNSAPPALQPGFAAAEAKLLYRLIWNQGASSFTLNSVEDYRLSTVGSVAAQSSGANGTATDGAGMSLSLINGQVTAFANGSAISNISVNGTTGTVAGGVASVTIAAGGVTNGQSGVNFLNLTVAGATTISNSLTVTGSQTNSKPVVILGSTDAPQLSIKANATQNSNVFEVLASDGSTVRGAIKRDGVLTLNSITSAGGVRDIFIQGNPASSAPVGSDNIYIGYNVADSSINTPGQNVMIGNYAGQNQNASANCVYIGYWSAYNDSARANNDNVCIGAYSGRQMIGGYSSFLGDYAGAGVTGSYNSSLGYHALDRWISAGNYGTENNTTAIGAYAGYTQIVSTRSNNIFVGYYAGRWSTNNSDTIVIDNRNRGTPAGENTNALIRGTMASNRTNQTLAINANVTGITLNAESGVISGGNNISGGYTANPANLLPFVVDGTATFTTAMISTNACWYITPTNAVWFTTDAGLTNSAVVSTISLDVFYNDKTFGWVGPNMTNTATLTSNEWNSVLFRKGYGKTIMTGR